MTSIHEYELAEGKTTGEFREAVREAGARGLPGRSTPRESRR